MKVTPSRRITIAAALLLAISAALAIFYPRTLQYPYLEIEVPGGMIVTMLMDGQATGEPCEQTLHNLSTGFLTVCPQCRTRVQLCAQTLSPEQNELLSEQPLNTYSARLPNGITVYESSDPALAAFTCRESERQSAKSAAPVKCHAPGVARPTAQPDTKTAAVSQTLLAGFGLAVTGLLASWFVCWLIVRFEHLHAHLTHDHVDGGPQKFHSTPTPRVGGLAVMAGLLAVSAAITVFEARLTPLYRFSPYNYNLLLIAGIPAFLGGLIEDVTKKVSVIDRLLLTMASGVLAAWLLGAVLDRLDLPGIDALLTWLPFALLVTAVAVGGVANAINIIDGYNGLAAGYAIIVLCAFAWVSAQTQDTLLLHAALALIGALAGFLAWNWPKGRIFLGDGGAYLLGFLLAEISVLLVVRNPEVSPWFPVLLLVYPIFETLFSIYRRKVARGQSPGRPDALHLHQLIYCRLLQLKGQSASASKCLRNGRVAPYYWIVAIIIGAVGIGCYDNTPLLAVGAVLFCVAYLWLYRRITSWKAPRWMMQNR